MTTHGSNIPSLAINIIVSTAATSLAACANMNQPPHRAAMGSEIEASGALSSTDSPLTSLQIPQSPTAASMDGETLRSRANSFNSNVESTRSRTNSDVGPTRSRYEGDELTVDEALRPDKGNENDFKAVNNPFAFSPGQLNKLLNPKSLAAFKALSGIRGLELGLRTDLQAGLSVDEVSITEPISFEVATKAARERKIVDGPIRTDQNDVLSRDVPGQFSDRKQIYKDNRLPARKSLSIWKLFWNAYNDRILILLTFAAAISLALGIYETVGRPVPEGETQPIDWVEGLAM